MKPRRTMLGSAPLGIRRFQKRADYSRRIAWAIVAAAAVTLAFLWHRSTADATARREAAADAIASEIARIEAQSQARHRESLNRVIAAEQARLDDRLEDDREKLREQEGLRRSRKELEDSIFELKQAQDEAAR